MTDNLEPTGTETPGTTAQNPSGTGAEGSQGGAGEETVSIPKAVYEQHLREKNNRAEEQRRLQELEALVQEREAAVPPTGGYSEQQRIEEQLRQAHMNLQVRAQNGDEDAMMTLSALQMTRQTQAQLNWRLDSLSVPEADRRAAEQKAQQMRVMPTVAYSIIEAERLRAQKADLEARERALAEAEAAKKRGVVATTVTGIPTHETNDGTIKGSDYKAKMERYKAEGRMDLANDLRRKTDAGTLRILYGE